MTVVWIPDLNWHKILRTIALNFSKNYEWFEKPYQKLERVFHQVSKHLEVGQKTRLRLVFSTHFSGFGFPGETLFLVFDILHVKQLHTVGAIFGG